MKLGLISGAAALGFALVACSLSGASPITPPLALTQPAAATAIPTSNPSVDLPTLTATPAAASPTTTLVPLSLEGTPPPPASVVISPANAGRLVEIARWGKGPADSLCFSPDGKILAVASPTGIDFYDPKTWQESLQIDTQGPVGKIAFSSDGKSLAAIVGQNQVNLYEVTSGREIHTFSTQYKDGITSVALSPDGKALAYAVDDFTIQLVDIGNGNLMQTFRGNTAPVTSLVFFADSQTLASGATNQSVILWDVSSGNAQHTLTDSPGGGSYSPVAQVAVSPDGRFLTAAFDLQELTIWDAVSDNALHHVQGDRASTTFLSAAFSPDGRTLAAGTGDGSTWLIDVQSGSKIGEFKGSADEIAYSPDGQTLALGDSSSTLTLLDAHSGHVLRVAEEHSGPLAQMALSADGKTLVASYSGSSPSFKAFAMASGAPHDLNGGSGCRTDFLALSPDGRTVALVCSTKNGQAFIGRLDVGSGQLAGQITQQPFINGVEVGAIAFSPDGQTLAVGSSLDYTEAPQVRFYQTAGGSRSSQEPFTDSVNSLAFSADGKLLAEGPVETVQCDGCEALERPVRIWDVAAGKQILSLHGYKSSVTGLAFSPDSKLLATGSDDQTIRVWDLSSGQEVRELGPVGLGMHLAFSPSGDLLIAGVSNGMVSLWDTSNWEHVAAVSASAGAVKEVAFTPDGRFMVTGAEDGVIRFWAVQP